MKLKLLSLVALTTAMGAGIAGCPYVQGQPVCLIGHGYYTVKYTLKPGQSVTGPCADKKGEFLGVAKYNRPNAPNDQTIALKPKALTEIFADSQPGQADTAIIATGKLQGGDPDQEHFCVAPQFSPLSYGGIGYQFSNVKFYVTPQIPGTQFTADLAYSEGAGCTANYSVVGVFPVVSCKDSDGNPDNTLCAQVDHEWSGLALNPDFPTKCENLIADADPDNRLTLCVLDSATIPVLKAKQ
jgi:hypothetical protein